MRRAFKKLLTHWQPDELEPPLRGEIAMDTLKIGAAILNPSTRSICADGETRSISPKSMAVLNLLIETGGDVVSRTSLLERAWSDVCVSEEVLTQAIAELRRAFGDTPRDSHYIQTVPKSGYRLLPHAIAYAASNDALLPPHSAATETSIEAVTDYFSACEAYDRGGRKNIESAIKLCRNSIAHDPTFAAAHAWLSVALAYKQLYYGQENNLMKEALASARASIEYDRTAPEGYAAQGFALAQLGDIDHAITSFKAAMRTRADSFYPLNFFGVILFARGAYDAAARVFDRAAALRGDAFQAVMMSAKASRAAGDQKGAAARITRAAWRCDQRLAEDPGDIRALICKTYCQIDAGGIGSADLFLEQLQNNNDPITYYVVAALARAGEKAVAIDRFEAIVDNGWADSAFLQSDKDLDPLRGEPRFQKIANSLAA